ncbi:hypothetical protein C8J56DRAFT_894992 [Mycena floridula]|nr:hypothetical protein C8J56DRAFT_894992 [Mycena floridula]
MSSDQSGSFELTPESLCYLESCRYEMAFSSRQLIYNSRHNFFILPTQTEIAECKAIIIVENLEVVDVLRQRIAVIKEEVKRSESVVEQETKLSLQSYRLALSNGSQKASHFRGNEQSATPRRYCN